MTWATRIQEQRELQSAEREQRLSRQGVTSIPRSQSTYEGNTGRAVPKTAALRSEEYRRLVAALPCIACGLPGFSQAAHPNTGKGIATKTDDRLCFPLCGPRMTGAGGIAGCHALFDQGAMYPKDVRRLVEPAWTADTQRRIIAAGQWPKNLPMLDATALPEGDE
jgi:hypothetical protein